MTEPIESNPHQPPTAKLAPTPEHTRAAVGLFWGLVFAVPLFLDAILGAVQAIRTSHLDWNYLGKPFVFLLTGMAVAFVGRQWSRSANRIGCFGFLGRCLLLAGLVSTVLFVGSLVIKRWVVGGSVSDWFAGRGFNLLLGFVILSLFYVALLGMIVRWRTNRKIQ